MSVIGVVLAVRWFLELKKQKKCGGCKECKKTVGKTGFVPMLAAGNGGSGINNKYFFGMETDILYVFDILIAAN